MNKNKQSTMTRVSVASLERVRHFATKEGMTLSKALDYVITKFFKNNKYYELD